ncbi:alpha/beta hydrolase [Moraxella bovoculi]|uniref:alpha/beta hydrolase n=1 Tax=Moraxella bovoculi TaxID=386891 RepID=UPI000AD6CDF8|nr:alpha/beta hydrolase [Moraxella bovoculi]
MKKLLLVAFISAFTLSASASEPAQSKSAHLLVPEYQDLSALTALGNLDAMIAQADLANPDQTRAILQTINADLLKQNLATAPQATSKLTAPKAGDQPAVGMYVFEPKVRADKSPVIYFIHGGGCLVGSAVQQNAELFELAEQVGAVVVSVEYRQAGDAPFPADINDAYHALSYVFDNAESLGFDEDKIIIMGESAGGGLAARLALKVRDLGEYQPAGQVLIYPMLDHRTGTAESPYANDYAGEFVWKPEYNRLGWGLLKGGQDISDGDLPYYSASMAKELKGLPRTYIMVGGLDLFVNEDIDYANRLIKAGAATDLLVINGVYHAFEKVNPTSPQTKAYHATRTEAIKRMLNP